jgi:hypothetical protein
LKATSLVGVLRLLAILKATSLLLIPRLPTILPAFLIRGLMVS